MKTIESIEKRRRELRFMSLFLIYFQSLVVFGLFFFIDQIIGFFDTLQYNLVLRTFFVSVIIAFIVYLARKERAQSELTKELLEEMNHSADQLRKELKYNKFLRDVSYLVENLRDDAALKKLFILTLRFLNADGGAVILRNPGMAWKPPLAIEPKTTDPAFIDDITRIIGKSGRSFVQPQPNYPDHRLIKSAKSVMAVPLRLDNRFYGLIAFWSNRDDVVFDQSDLNTIEVMAKETAKSEFSFEQAQEQVDQFEGLLNLIADSGDGIAKTKKRTARLITQARAVAIALGLSEDTIEAIETAARLRHVDLIANGSAPPGSSAADIVASLNFPKPVVEALTEEDQASDPKHVAPIAAQVLALSDIYVTKAFPPRGRRPDPEKVLSKIEPLAHERFEDKVFTALKEVALFPTPN